MECADGRGAFLVDSRFACFSMCGYYFSARRIKWASTYLVRSAITLLLVPTLMFSSVPQIVASLLRCRGRAVAVNDREVEQRVLMKLAHRAGKDLVDTAVGMPAPHSPVDTRVVVFWETFGTPFDRQHLPLTAHVQQLQDVVEDFVQRQRGCGPRRPQLRCGKTNSSNCSRLNIAGIARQLGVPAIHRVQKYGPLKKLRYSLSRISKPFCSAH